MIGGIDLNQIIQLIVAAAGGGLGLKILDGWLNRGKVRADVTVTFTDQVMDYSDRLKADLADIRTRLSSAEADNERLRLAYNAILDEREALKRERAGLLSEVEALRLEVAQLRIIANRSSR